MKGQEIIGWPFIGSALAADGVVRGKEFPELWVRANRAVRALLDAVLSGDGGRVVRL